MAVQSSQVAQQLASTIATATAKVEEWRQAQGLPPLSLGPDATVDTYPPDIEKHRQELIAATLELRDLALGPGDLCNLPGWTELASSRFISDFEIPKKVPLQGDFSYDELSKLTGVKTGVLKTTLRAAMSFQYFYEARPGYVAHTATTKLWAQQQLVQDWFNIASHEWVVGAMKISDTMKTHPEADDPANAPFMMAMGSCNAYLHLHY